MTDPSEALPTPISELLRLHQQGRLDEAAAGYRVLLDSPEARSRDASRVEWQVALANLAAIEAARGRLDEAVHLYERARSFAPNQTRLAYNLGCVLARRGEPARAAAVLSEFCDASPKDFDARLLLARSLRLSEQPEAAAVSHRQALELRPEYAIGYRLLGNILRELGRADQAIEAYRRGATHGDPMASHLASALAGEVSDGAPAEYVRTLFDLHAEEYDGIMDGLGSRGQALLAQALSKLGPGPSVRRALDLGCGTGLCAPILVDRCAELVGVDLSPGMLRAAAARGGYHALEEADVVEFLLRRPAAHWDLIVAADVLVYLGELTPFFRAVRHGLAAGGHHIFTIERSDEAEHTLQRSGRFAHSASYVQRLAAEVGLQVLTLSSVTLRREGDQDVHGYVIVLSL